MTSYHLLKNVEEGSIGVYLAIRIKTHFQSKFE